MLQYKIKIYEKEYIEVNLNLVEFRGKLKKLTRLSKKKYLKHLAFLSSMGDF